MTSPTQNPGRLARCLGAGCGSHVGPSIPPRREAPMNTALLCFLTRCTLRLSLNALRGIVLLGGSSPAAGPVSPDHCGAPEAACRVLHGPEAALPAGPLSPAAAISQGPQGAGTALWGGGGLASRAAAPAASAGSERPRSGPRAEAPVPARFAAVVPLHESSPPCPGCRERLPGQFAWSPS